MQQTAQTLNGFFNGFGMDAYARSDVPKDVDLPYIAFDLVEPTWDRQGNMSIQIYYPKGMLKELLMKADEISAEIGQGVKFSLDGGYLVLYPGGDSSKQQDEWSESIYKPLLINAYHQPGI